MQYLAVAFALLHVLLAVAVFRDTRSREDHGKPLAFVGPLTWCLATLLSGLASLALYWVMHYSSLRGEGQEPVRP